MNNINTPKTTEIFLKTGNNILKLRKEIIDLFHKLTKLNPFNEENYNNFLLYAEDIIQDNELIKKEQPNFVQYRNSKLIEKNNSLNLKIQRILTSQNNNNNFSENIFNNERKINTKKQLNNNYKNKFIEENKEDYFVSSNSFDNISLMNKKIDNLHKKNEKIFNIISFQKS